MKKQFFQSLAATSFLVLSFLFSCEKEDLQLVEPAQDVELSNIMVEQVGFSAIPELSKALTDSSGKSVLPRSHSGKEGSGFWIDESDVLKLKDSVDNESYSIVIHSDDPSPTKLYNLVVTKRTEGDPMPPFVVEYNFEAGDRSSFAEDDEKHFEGTLNIYALSEFAKITGLNAKDDDPVICFQDVGVRDNAPADNNSAPSPPGNPGGGAPSAPSGNPSGPSAIVTRTHISVNNNFQSTGVSVGIGTFYMSRPIKTNEDHQDQKTHIMGKEKPNDCPEGWVSVPINEIVTFEDKIDDAKLKPCLQKILADLKNTKNGVGSIIQKFAGNTPGFNWEVKDGMLSGQTGQTSQSYNRQTKTATTAFDSQSWKQATELSWARTILHESVHAYIVASFGTNPVNSQKTFVDFYNDYLNRTYPNGNATHHAEIARNFVNDIGLALKEYGISRGYNLSNQFYNDMAWGGLTDWAKRDSFGNIIRDSNGNTTYTETPWFIIAVPSSADRKRIKDTFTVEIIGFDTNGNKKTQKGKNAGC